MLPQDFLKTLPEIVGEKNLEKVIDAFSKKRPTTFRVNTLKTTSSEIEKILNQMGVKYKKVPWNNEAFILEEGQTLEDSEIYKNGYIYVQSLSSMIPALVLNPKKNESILDLTAAPGSKTTQISTLMENTGEIIANDTSRPRIYKLEFNLKVQGVENVKVTQLPGQILWEKFSEYFDKTLADVPCSMEGRFNTLDNKTYRDWTIGKVKQLAPRQAYLLRSAISATKVGGEIVYSTCTLSPEENEGVIDWILKKEGENIEVCEINIEGLEMQNGLLEYKGKKYNPEIKKAKRILPSETMEGFFICKIRKIKSNLV